jgi:hypothetical protein
MFDFIKNAFMNRNRYKTSSKAVIISCFMNPQNNPYRLLAFQKFYRSIKHLNHRIIECLIGDAKSQLPDSPYITQVQSDSLLWHKESLLNMIVDKLPHQFEYVFWIDADVLFTNNNWLVEAVEELESGSRIVQPFEYCIHLQRNELKPSFDVESARWNVSTSSRHPEMWRSFCSNVDNRLYHDTNYDRHGHVGFAWGARREVLAQCPLFDNALIGGADHIIAHAAAGHIPHHCITKSFTENLPEVEAWSKKFYRAVLGRIGYVKGDLYHIWHGDINNRQYLKRIQDYTPQTKALPRDANGLYVRTAGNTYMKRYYRNREVGQVYYDDGFNSFYDAALFVEDMGYAISDLVQMFGRPTYDDSDVPVEIPAPAEYASPVEIPAPPQPMNPPMGFYQTDPYQQHYAPTVPDSVMEDRTGGRTSHGDLVGGRTLEDSVRYTDTGESGRDNPGVQYGETGESGNFS